MYIFQELETEASLRSLHQLELHFFFLIITLVQSLEPRSRQSEMASQPKLRGSQGGSLVLLFLSSK